MSNNFRVGQRVVRINFHKKGSVPASWMQRGRLTNIGKIYTIRAINVWPRATLLRFQELDNSHLVAGAFMIEPGFDSRGFRPIVERKTDISVFQQLLNPSPARVNEPV